MILVHRDILDLEGEMDRKGTSEHQVIQVLGCQEYREKRYFFTFFLHTMICSLLWYLPGAVELSSLQPIYFNSET